MRKTNEQMERVINEVDEELFTRDLWDRANLWLADERVKVTVVRVCKINLFY